MKTAISIPDSLFAEAEQFAHHHGLSRSELYVHALRQYLQTHRYAGVTSALDQVYSDQPSGLDTAFIAAQQRGLPQDEW